MSECPSCVATKKRHARVKELLVTTAIVVWASGMFAMVLGAAVGGAIEATFYLAPLARPDGLDAVMIAATVGLWVGMAIASLMYIEEFGLGWLGRRMNGPSEDAS